VSFRFLMTGGGTGGHVFPAVAVARVLRERGHSVRFLGTAEGLEAKLVPQAGFEIDFIRIGGLNRVGVVRQLRTLMQLPVSVISAVGVLRRQRPAAVFSMGGYVAGPVMLAALACGVPLVVMEPNAMPGFANRKVARYVYKALVGFESTSRWFPKDRTEIIGLPVRKEFFEVAERAKSMTGGLFTVLITGGSRGSRTLNRASRESWTLFRDHRTPLRLIHQTGAAEHEQLARDFAASGLEGEVVAFISDMASAFAGTDLIVARSGAGAVAEIGAAGLPSLLVPLPFAADDHQRKNAEALAEAGAARIVLDKEMTGERLFREVEELRNHPQRLEEMGRQALRFRKPGGADRAADVLEEAGAEKMGIGSKTSGARSAE
jgi:UDP-N-acetylglucosamine--N-acetylmuramyl-(pentapeptide) pyrophosphoryl-undecaprenol N-acetylglucosamine transferase